MPNISNPARDIPQLFHADLQKDEKILWSGRPEPQWFTSADFVLIPFSLLWGGFAFFWEGSVITIYLKHGQKAPGTLFMVFWGIPFVCIGTYLILGRFFVQRWMQKNTFYAVTNQRVLILSTLKNRSINALFLDNLPELSKSVNSKGVGTIVFAADSRLPALLAFQNDPVIGRNRRNPTTLPAFTNIKEADKVYEIISKQRKKT